MIVPAEIVALALLSAAAFGAASPLSKLGFEEGGTPFQAALTVVTVGLILFWTAIAVAGGRVLEHPLEAIALFAITGVLGTAIARVIAYTGVQRVGASVYSAGVNTRPMFATAGAMFFLGESMTFQTAIGIGVVVVGLIVVAISRGGDIRGWRTVDMAFPVGAAIAYASGNVVRRYGFTTTDMTPLGGVAVNELAGFVALSGYVFVRYRGDERDFLVAPRRAYLWFVAAGGANALALFALFEALDRGRVVVVDPISSPTSLFAIVFTSLLLGEVEQVTRRLIIGATLVVIGIVLITTPQVFSP